MKKPKTVNVQTTDALRQRHPLISHLNLAAAVCSSVLVEMQHDENHSALSAKRASHNNRQKKRRMPTRLACGKGCFQHPTLHQYFVAVCTIEMLIYFCFFDFLEITKSHRPSAQHVGSPRMPPCPHAPMPTSKMRHIRPAEPPHPYHLLPPSLLQTSKAALLPRPRKHPDSPPGHHPWHPIPYVEPYSTAEIQPEPIFP